MGIFDDYRIPYTDFHRLNLDWILRIVHEFKGTMETLDERIKEIVEQELDEINLNKMILDALTEYGLVINVKAPPANLTPAVGDGTKDDTESIQGCIDYAFAQGGRTVFFPSGKYLTGSLNLRNNVSLAGFDYSTTHLVLKGGAINPLINGSSTNNSFNGLTFDANMEIQVNEVNGVVLNGDDYSINNCRFTDSYNNLSVNLNQGYFKISNIIFGSAVVSHLRLSGNGSVIADNLLFERLSTQSGEYDIDNYVDNSCFYNIYSNSNTNTSVHNISNGSVFTGRIVNAINTHHSEGNNNYFNFYNRGGTLQDSIDTERTERENADTELDGKITTERSERIASDSTLDSKISTEKTDREEADSLIRDSIALINNDIINLKKGTIINVVQNGAVGDGVTDDSVVINQLMEDNPTAIIYLPSGYNFLCNSTLDIKSEHFICKGRITSTADIAMSYNKVDGSCEVYQLYGNGSGTGFQTGKPDMKSSYGNSNFKFYFIWNFETGIKYYANGNNGIQNNMCYISRIDNCENGIMFECGEDSTPWINQNIFNGGWIFATTARPEAKGIVFKKGSNMIDRFNGNVFNDFSCEGTRYPIEIEYAWHNVFNNFRLLENVGSRLIYCKADTEDNKFIGASSYVSYLDIEDHGLHNNYKLTFHNGQSINVCNEATFYVDNFVPLRDYYMPTSYTATQGTGLSVTTILEYLTIDGSTYNVEVVLPPRYSLIDAQNEFYVETKTLAGFARVVLWGGQIIATSENASSISGVILKPNMRYKFIPVGPLQWIVIPLTVSSIISTANVNNPTSTVTDNIATLNDTTVNVNNVINY